MSLAIEDELPISIIPNIPKWSENYWFDSFDSSRNIAFFCHFGRWHQDPRLWREQAYIYLPDGNFAVHRGFGARESTNGPRGATLAAICDQVEKRWRLQYRGAARYTTPAELAHVPLPEIPLRLSSFDLEWSSELEVWNWATLDTKGEHFTDIHGKFHYEGSGRVTGTIEHGAKSYAIQGAAYRDHTRGPRHFGGTLATCWIHGRFKDWAFALVDATTEENGRRNVASSKAVIWEGGKMYAADASGLPYLESWDTAPRDYLVTLTSILGRRVVKGNIKRSLTFTVSLDYDWYYGLVPELGYLAVYEDPTVFECADEHGEGWTERSFRFPRD